MSQQWWQSWSRAARLPLWVVLFCGWATGALADGPFEELFGLPGPQSYARYGSGVSSGDVDDDGFNDLVVGWDGGVHVFHGGMGFDAEPDWAIAPPDDEARLGEFGRSVVSGGDLDGDGAHDVVVAATRKFPVGSVYVFFGGTRRGEFVEIVGDEYGFGRSMAIPGDLNGDGFDDLVVSSPSAVSDRLRGAVYVFDGGADFAPKLPAAKKLLGSDGEEIFGTAVAGVGDFNGDSHPDLAVGSGPDTAYLQVGPGRVDVYYGGPEFHDQPNWSVVGSDPVQHMGAVVACAGDVNADGFDDMLVVSAYDQWGWPAGASRVVHLFLGAGEPSTASVLDLERPTGDTTDLFGMSACNAGDVNGDGFGDYVIGTYSRAWVYLGSVLPGEAVAQEVSGNGTPTFGSKVIGVSRLSNTFGRDLIVAANQANASGASSGEVTVFSYAPFVGASPAKARSAIRNARIWPNPANPRTTVEFDLLEAGTVSISVYDSRGRIVRTRAADLPPGRAHRWVWDGADAGGHGVASGTYFVLIESGSSRDVLKVAIVR